MRYLLLVVCLVIVAVVVCLGIYTSVGREVVYRFFPIEVQQEDLPEDISADDATSRSDVYALEVTSIVDREYGYDAFVTQVNDGFQYEMPVSLPDLGEQFVSLKIGDFVYVEVDSVEEREFPALSLLYPITITVIEE